MGGCASTKLFICLQPDLIQRGIKWNSHLCVQRRPNALGRHSTATELCFCFHMAALAINNKTNKKQTMYRITRSVSLSLSGIPAMSLTVNSWWHRDSRNYWNIIVVCGLIAHWHFTYDLPAPDTGIPQSKIRPARESSFLFSGKPVFTRKTFDPNLPLAEGPGSEYAPMKVWRNGSKWAIGRLTPLCSSSIVK